jgi:hypothetical protein
MGEDKLTVVAELPAPFQQTALEGARRRTADDGLPFLPQTDKQKFNEPAVRQAFRDVLGTSIYSQLGGAENLYQAALDFYVGSQARAGQQGGWRQGQFAKAVKVMFGATTRADGSWQGGLGTVRGRRSSCRRAGTKANLTSDCHGMILLVMAHAMPMDSLPRRPISWRITSFCSIMRRRMARISTSWLTAPVAR